MVSEALDQSSGGGKLSETWVKYASAGCKVKGGDKHPHH
jgi:hypothetical protein